MYWSGPVYVPSKRGERRTSNDDNDDDNDDDDNDDNDTTTNHKTTASLRMSRFSTRLDNMTNEDDADATIIQQRTTNLRCSGVCES